MVIKAHIQLVSEPNEAIVWEMYQGNAQFPVTGRAYAMKVFNATTTVTFVCTVDGYRVECIGDCSSLDPDINYEYRVTEDGSTIIAGTASVITGMP